MMPRKVTFSTGVDEFGSCWLKIFALDLQHNLRRFWLFILTLFFLPGILYTHVSVLCCQSNILYNVASSDSIKTLNFLQIRLPSKKILQNFLCHLQTADMRAGATRHMNSWHCSLLLGKTLEIFCTLITMHTLVSWRWTTFPGCAVWFPFFTSTLLLICLTACCLGHARKLACNLYRSLQRVTKEHFRTRILSKSLTEHTKSTTPTCRSHASIVSAHLTCRNCYFLQRPPNKKYWM